MSNDDHCSPSPRQRNIHSTVASGNGQAVTSSENQARMLFVECSTPEDIGRKSKSNEGQANICHEVCRMLCTEATRATTQSRLPATRTIEQQLIAVLTPYSRQVELLKCRLSHFANVEVSKARYYIIVRLIFSILGE